MVDQVSLWNSVLAPPGVARGQGVKEAVLADPNRFFADTRPGFRVVQSSDHTTPTPSYLHDTEGTLRLWSQGGMHDREQQSFAIPKGNQFSKISRVALDASKNIPTDEGGVPQNGFGDIGVVPMQQGRVYPYIGYDPPISKKFNELSRGSIQPRPMDPEFAGAVPGPPAPPPAPTLPPSYGSFVNASPVEGVNQPIPSAPSEPDESDAFSALTSFLKEGGVGEDSTSSAESGQYVSMESVKDEDYEMEDVWGVEYKVPKTKTKYDDVEEKLSFKWAELDRRLDELNKASDRLSPEDEASMVLDNASNASDMNQKLISAVKEAYEKKDEGMIDKWQGTIVDSMIENNEKISKALKHSKKKTPSNSRMQGNLEMLNEMIMEQNQQLRAYQRKENQWETERMNLMEKQRLLNGELERVRRRNAEMTNKSAQDIKEEDTERIRLEERLKDTNQKLQTKEKERLAAVEEAQEFQKRLYELAKREEVGSDSYQKRLMDSEEKLGKERREKEELMQKLNQAEQKVREYGGAVRSSEEIVKEQQNKITSLEDVLKKQIEISNQIRSVNGPLQERIRQLEQENQASAQEKQLLLQENRIREQRLLALKEEKEFYEKETAKLGQLGEDLRQARAHSTAVVEDNAKIMAAYNEGQDALMKALEAEKRARVAANDEIRKQAEEQKRQLDRIAQEKREAIAIKEREVAAELERVKAQYAQELTQREQAIIQRTEEEARKRVEVAEKKAQLKVWLQQRQPDNVSIVDALFGKIQTVLQIPDPAIFNESVLDISQFLLNQGVRVYRTDQSDAIANQLLFEEFDYSQLPSDVPLSAVVRSVAAMIEQFQKENNQEGILVIQQRFARMIQDLPYRDLPAEYNQMGFQFLSRTAVTDPFVLTSIALIVSQIEAPLDNRTPAERVDEKTNVKRETGTNETEMDEDVTFLYEIPAGTNVKQEPTYTDINTVKAEERAPPVNRMSVMGTPMEEKTTVKNEGLINQLAAPTYFMYRERGVYYYEKLPVDRVDGYEWIQEITDPNELIGLRARLPSTGSRVQAFFPSAEFGYNVKTEIGPTPPTFIGGPPPLEPVGGIPSATNLSTVASLRNEVLEEEKADTHAEAVKAVKKVKKQMKLPELGERRISRRRQTTIRFRNRDSYARDQSLGVEGNADLIRAGNSSEAYKVYKGIMSKSNRTPRSREDFDRQIAPAVLNIASGDLTGIVSNLLKQDIGVDMQVKW